MSDQELLSTQAQEDGGDDDEGSGGPRLNITMEEKVVIALETAQHLFGLLGGRQPSVQCRAEDEQVVVGLADLDPILCPPGDTRVLESVQFILNKAINRMALRRTRLSLDADGFRRRRPEGLDKVAAALAAKVLHLDRPLAIGPLGQGDLRFLTAQFSRSPGIAVHAVGTGERRRLLILPTALHAQMLAQEALANANESPPSDRGPDRQADRADGAEGGGGDRRRRRRR